MVASCVVWHWLSSACSPPGCHPTYQALAGVGLLEHTHSRCHSHPLASSLHEAALWPGSETPGVPTSLHTLDEPSPGGGIPACGVVEGVHTHTQYIAAFTSLYSTPLSISVFAPLISSHSGTPTPAQNHYVHSTYLCSCFIQLSLHLLALQLLLRSLSLNLFHSVL